MVPDDSVLRLSGLQTCRTRDLQGQLLSLLSAVQQAIDFSGDRPGPDPARSPETLQTDCQSHPLIQLTSPADDIPKILQEAPTAEAPCPW